ncbi:MAG: DUF3303 domain-containing protein [Gemmatimonadota bacterium]|nr:DUF3303 domain-containing protein [Gemmatimonadota bacterium]
MHYMIVERFRLGPRPAYARFRDHGRLAPDGLRYVTSWVATDGDRCYQVMECDDRALIDEWMTAWTDLVDFEVIPVITSAEAAATFA